MKRLLFIVSLLLFSHSGDKTFIMKKYVLSVIVVLNMFFLQSCEIKDDGSIGLSGLGWFLLFAFIIGCVIAIVVTSIQQKDSKMKMDEMGLSYSDFHFIGTYVGGHPNLDKTIENVYYKKESTTLSLYEIPLMKISIPEKIAEIPINDISNISIEDSSTIEKRITLGRVLLVGVFALAWRKKKKEELSFLLIEWKKGRFEHTTTFSFTGKEAFTKANSIRNNLISLCE